MDRKYFLSSIALATASVSVLKSFGKDQVEGSAQGSSSVRIKMPPYLKPGDTIGICSPASYISLQDIQPSIRLMESWGFKVLLGNSLGQKDFTLGGTDEVRASDFQMMLDNPKVNAIMCARGGYGIVRVIDKLDFNHFRKQPKWIIGFSDITMLHTHINSRFRIATIHSKMCNSFPSDWTLATPMQIETILSIRQVLAGEPVKYTASPSISNRKGRVEGCLVGGNLSLIETAAGTESDLHTDGKILFLEDTQEQLYSIDRMLWNLKRSGKLAKLKGLIIGGFKVKIDTEGDEFGKTVYDLVLEKVRDYDYPVCFDFPVGHQVNNYALKCGVPHLLAIDENGSSLTSIL
ncbi:MAG: LD-carboxypeptidase [Bacteroidota bacterium]